ncbi:radical SAM protein [Vibrio alginolyticus]|uniref:4Fe-4S single cluster domain-containing protein n=1 Tax=Vibrio alginolyticus TaxID=663 RepID=UPI001BD4A8CA|nr:4Fe-4S single cluster domain-containing protein [Vibrio alginolyticus]MBT0108714.1 radical SAM protein [Vibrio alginolyticus]HDU8577901.1 radical SAM protein [Vibrio diabolicus]
MSYLNIAAVVDQTNAEGPGLRTAIWVQGCLKRCRGCCNPAFLEIKPAKVLSSEDICQRIKSNHQHYGIEGITLLGGEPFLQAVGLADIAKFTQELGLTVMIFTGYNMEELSDEKFKGASKLTQFTDLLIDGEYDHHQSETHRNWVGSTNQNFHYISERYDESIEIDSNAVTNEWRISSENKIVVNGLPFIVRNIE